MIPTPIHRCRACASQDLDEVVSLGPIHPNEFPLAKPTHAPVPLTLLRCAKCTLVQLSVTTPPDWLFREYFYRSSVNETMVQALHEVATAASDFVSLQEGDTIVDIGCNDGTLLQSFAYKDKPAASPFRRIGFEPALNLTPTIPSCEVLIRDYFTEQVAKTELRLQAKLVFSIAMFYDLDDPNAFVHAVKQILHPEGVWVLQFQDVLTMLQTTAFDGICHEHLLALSLYALQQILATNALIVQDVEHVSINGGSLRCYVQHADQVGRRDRARVLAQLRREQAVGLHGSHGIPQIFPTFRYTIGRIREQVQGTLHALKDAGIPVAGYGASTKFNVFSEYCGIDQRLIRSIAERSPAKWGRTTITGIPIVSEEQWRKEKPQASFVGIPQFREAILQREANYLSSGGAFLFGLPAVEWVSQQAVEV